MEAVVGFALLTATVTWVLGTFPALARRRAVALRISQLRRADVSDRALSTPHAATMLQGLISDLAHVCVDFRQYAESYYFSLLPVAQAPARIWAYPSRYVPAASNSAIPSPVLDAPMTPS
ncbi:hypothetical protein [Streptomyces chryseus]|uniref:hypothetical protein n=1 Tax=Streptomyces chryseus TaxID=68186 RepID=UPI001672D8E3|nr:hypothetical protein [Streptomyces chryseus]GGX43144.1 hypothetical protein GCM10010353_67830 [Streptomyces chryseus]